MKNLTLLLLFSVVLSNQTYGQQRTDLSWQAENSEIYLHNTDVGPSFAELYGHVQIRVRDLSGDGDYMVSWGLFDYGAPNFGLNFYKGRLLYSVGVFDTRRAMVTYRYDERSVWENLIYFTKQQKERLLRKISHDLKPENRQYLYNYFWDNCSTRPRDFLDYAIGGQLKKAVEGELSQDTWRDVVRRHQSIVPFSALALEVLMNSNLDVYMTKWQEMFLPHKLREAMLALPQFNDNFEPVAGTSLLGPTRDFYVGKVYEFYPNRDYYLFAGYFLFSLLLMGLSRRFRPQLYPRLLGLFTFFWFGLSGAFGVLMPVSWLFSDHLDLHHNVNMLLFWPVDWLWLYLSWCLLRARPLPSGAMLRVYKWMFYGHFLAVGVMIILETFSLVDQNLRVVLLTYGIASLVYWRMVLRRLYGVAKS